MPETETTAGDTGAVTTATCRRSHGERLGQQLGRQLRSVEDVPEAMKDVVDPELGINVVDLGLVYGVHVDEDANAVLDMTLTSAACPLTDVIEDQTHGALEGLVNDVAHQLGLDAAVGPGQDHRRRPRAAARPRLQRLSRTSMDAVETFWQVARSHARLQPLPGYFPATPVGAVPPPTWSFARTPRRPTPACAGSSTGPSTTLTVSLRRARRGRGAGVPEVGTLGIVLDGAGNPRALVVTERVEVGPLEVVEQLRVLHQPVTSRADAGAGRAAALGALGATTSARRHGATDAGARRRRAATGSPRTGRPSVRGCRSPRRTTGRRSRLRSPPRRRCPQDWGVLLVRKGGFAVARLERGTHRRLQGRPAPRAGPHQGRRPEPAAFRPTPRQPGAPGLRGRRRPRRPHPRRPRRPGGHRGRPHGGRGGARRPAPAPAGAQPTCGWRSRTRAAPCSRTPSATRARSPSRSTTSSPPLGLRRRRTARATSPSRRPVALSG